MTKGISLRGLEVFEALAGSGSVAGAADRTGLSLPAVSQQLRNLEAALGVDLVDHARRPMQLTAAGRAFLPRTRAILSQLKLAQSEVAVMDLTHLRVLNLGVIDDFDNDLTPRLVVRLSENLAQCRFKLVTAPSHEISAAMEAGDLHIAIAAAGEKRIENIDEYPLVQDPFILVCPKGVAGSSGDIEPVMQALKFLRYDRNQRIGMQIETQLQRCGLRFEDRFEIGSHLSMMALVARGAGWAITTALGFMRAQRFHADMDAHPLPMPAFSRQISLFAASDWAEAVPRDVARSMRGLAAETVIDPACDLLPWLEGELRVLPERATAVNSGNLK